MKGNKAIGLITIIASISMLTLTVIIAMQSIMASAFLIKLAIFNLCLLISVCGLFLLNSFGNPTKKIKIAIATFGAIFSLLSGLVAFNLMNFMEYWNLIIALGILYITLIQLKLLKWEKSKSLLKILGLLMFLSNAFLVIFFMAKLSMTSLAVVLDVTVVVSVFTFLVGLMISSSSSRSKRSISNN